MTMVQIGEKHHDIRAFIDRAVAVKAILNNVDVPLIINDRVDVALAVDADGVHLGQSDMPVEFARKLLGEKKILGLSIETPEQLEKAMQQPIDYIGLSAIFPTPSKTDTKTHWGIQGLISSVSQSTVPVVAIGGINSQNIRQVASTGVHGIALVSAVCHAQDPKKAAQLIRQCIDTA